MTGLSVVSLHRNFDKTSVLRRCDYLRDQNGPQRKNNFGHIEIVLKIIDHLVNGREENRD